MNFYASPEYLLVVADAYFGGERTAIEDVRVGGEVLRLLVVNDTHIVTRSQFLDYHEPLDKAEICKSIRRKISFVPRVVRGIVEQNAWASGSYHDFQPAPFVDWSMFATFDDYMSFIRSRQKGLVQRYEGLRRKLTARFSNIVFCMNDVQGDVIECARQWKSNQLRNIGVPDYFEDPKNIKFFELLRERGLLMASTLRADGRLISVLLGFVYKGTWSSWVFCYDNDPDIRRFSPGQQLLLHALEESFRQKHREFDFSIGGEDYKWIYATHARLVGHLGRTPMEHGIVNWAMGKAKKLLSHSPKLYEAARSLKRALCT